MWNWCIGCTRSFRIRTRFSATPQALQHQSGSAGKRHHSGTDRLPRGATAIVDFSEHGIHAIERAWIYSTLLYGDDVIRGGYLLVGILKTTNLRAVLHRMSRNSESCNLTWSPIRCCRPSSRHPEEQQPASDGSGMSATAQPGEASQAVAGAGSSKGSALKKYAVDLTASQAGAT